MFKTKTELSIVIISYNTKKITENCICSIITSLKNASLSYEIVIVDNNSTDGSNKMLENLKSQILNAKSPSQNSKIEIKIMQNNKNLGFAKANNQGVHESKGRYILLLNSDIEVLDDAIEKLFSFYKSREEIIHFLGGKLLNKDNSAQASCGPFYSLPVIFGALFLKGDHWGFSRYSPNSVKEVDWVSGACILTKKEYYDSIAGFDENIFMYMDEIDLLYRAKKNGHHIFFYPDAQFIHLGSASSQGRTYPILQVYKGFTYFYRKHHNDRISLFLLRIMLQLKSLIAIGTGKITGNRYLIETYEKAFQLSQMD